MNQHITVQQDSLRKKMLGIIHQLRKGNNPPQSIILALLDEYEQIRLVNDTITRHRLKLTSVYCHLFYLLAHKYSFADPTEEFVVLKKSDGEVPLDDCCGICCENHTLANCSTTQCGHYFGASCFDTWVNTRHNGNMALTCPMCNTIVTTVTKYRIKN